MHRTILLLTLTACGTDQPPTAPFQPPPEAPEVPQIPAPEPDEDLAYGYSPIGKADPFRPFIQKETPKKGDLPLQRWDVDQLQLVAVVTGVASPYAMVEDPEGLGHVVRRGDLIGKHWGRVFAIRKRKLTIQEHRLTVDGRKVAHTQSMVIPKLPVSDG